MHNARIARTTRTWQAFYKEKMGNVRAISHIVAYANHATPHTIPYLAPKALNCNLDTTSSHGGGGGDPSVLDANYPPN